ncbi:UNVERIFIED_ORG: hypothetical protein CLV66_11363 [Actinomadura viridilutea]
MPPLADAFGADRPFRELLTGLNDVVSRTWKQA